MPTYQYVCKTCNQELEELQAITDPPLVRCPRCGTDSLVRVVGLGAGLIFKGSGFYVTDYVQKDAAESTASETKKPEKQPDTSSASGSSPGTSSGSSEMKN